MTKFTNARNIAHILLQRYNRKEVSNELIHEEVNNLYLLPDFNDVDKEKLITQLEADFDIYSKEATLLVAEDVKPWLYDAKSSIKFDLWNRYKIYMNQKDASFPIDTLDDITDKILDKCVNPKVVGRWDRRGMVIGNVQSGKTANYTGLINKATDAGYKLIIIIAGIHNTLRGQTQRRIDNGFIGRDSSDFIKRHKNNKTGVGVISAETEIYSFTNSDSDGDFKKNIATKINVPIGGNSPTVLVIKKNKSILENLILWLLGFVKNDNKIINVPLLLIDDEADNASVNSGTELDVKTINRLIRTLLNLFNQNTFIGYTATPYANIFIPSSWSTELETEVKGVKLKVGEDLFPRDFIVNIPPPSNYIGATKVFGYVNEDTGENYERLNIIRYVNDQEPYFPKKLNRINKDELPDNLPNSLKEAIKSFILTCAIRRLRGQENKHNSMLIHVSLYVSWIDRVSWLVNEILRDYTLQIRSKQGKLLNELKELFEDDFVPTTDEVSNNISYKDPSIKRHTWNEVNSVLVEAVTKIEVRAVHGKKNTRHLEFHRIEDINYEDYENGLSVIAIGGNRLARGITLDGLSVSYYLRTSKLYDSLMQMGRWFGYRPGYVDLCRLYTTEQLTNWYRHVTLATEEMRADIDIMSAQNKRPVDYLLKIRTHPKILNITGAGKMREHEKIQIGFSGKIKQTYQLIKDKQVVKNNFKTFESLIGRMSNPTLRRTLKSEKTNGIIWNNVNPELIVDFILGYNSDLPDISPDILMNYINKQNTNQNLINWTVAVILNSESETQIKFNCNGIIIEGGLPVRNNITLDSREYFTLSKNNILDRKDRRLDLDLGDSNPKEGVVKQVRADLGKSLLVIYPLDWKVDKDLVEGIPLIGWGIIFPEIKNEEKVEFAARPMVLDSEDGLIDDDLDYGE